jgi:spermidine/putrescine transport system substrate-binding protein
MGKSTFRSCLDGAPTGRRAVLELLASVGVGVAVMPLTPHGADAAEQATVFTWSNYDDPQLFPAYIAAHGGPPEFSFLADTTEALNKIRAGYVVDVAHPCADDMGRWIEAGVIKAIDSERLIHVADFWDELKNLPDTVSKEDAAKRWFVPFDWGNSSIIYRTDLVDLKESSWSILYEDERYKGKVAMYDAATPAINIAAAILGFPDIFILDDAQLKEVAKLLRKQREMVKFYWTDQTTIEQAIASGELVAAYGWNDGFKRLKEQGVPVAFMDPKEGMRTWVCGLVLLRDAPHEDLAYDFINAFTAPEAGQHLLEAFGTGHANRKAFNRVDKKLLDTLGISNPAEMMARTTFLKPTPAAYEEKYNQLFTEVKAGG